MQRAGRIVRKARILVVDDEERILNALKSIFRQRYHVFATTDGNKALEFMKKYQMHMVISDQRMPIMPGVELLRQAREISPASVRILLTGYSDLASIVGSINDGQVYRFISKPWDNKELQQTVVEAVTIALELAEAKATPVALPQRMDAGVLVIDDDQEVFRVAKELTGGRCPVCYANCLDDALAAMQSQEIAVVVADVEAGHEDTTAMLKLLKQHVEAALERYLAFREAPQLLRQHQVQKSEQVRDSSVGQKMLSGLKSLRGRWFGAGAKR